MVEHSVDGSCSLKKAGQEEDAVLYFVQQVENSDHLLLLICAVRRNSTRLRDQSRGGSWYTAQGRPNNTLYCMQKLQN